jgi:hypothetical protein
MNNSNPYSSPKAVDADATVGNVHDHESLNRMAFARRIVNMCLFSWLAMAAFHILESHFIGGLAMLIVIAGAIFAVRRLAIELGSSSLWRALFIIAMFLPIINLLVMVLLSERATKTLVAARYRVGMFSAVKLPAQ